MSMFCYQCQEAAKNLGCTSMGVCGKKSQTSAYQDLLIYSLKGLSKIALIEGSEKSKAEAGLLVARALFATITNANFRDDHQIELIHETLALRESIKKALPQKIDDTDLTWNDPESEWLTRAATQSILAQENEDVRSLRELLIYGLKGLAAYATHAYALGYADPAIWHALLHGMASTLEDLSVEAMVAEVMAAGELAVTSMALLDKANTETYGHPELTKVNIGVGANPGILISGHDLHDMEELLKQTESSGVDVYTHSEMLPANYYPAFKKYSHLKGNYGNAWWKQDKEFASFNGPILMTTNCIVPVKDSYKNRIYTTGMAGYPDVQHLDVGKDGKKDFSALIEQAKTCSAPTELESGEIVGGFAHNQVLALADKVVDAVKSGAIKRFVVMAGCDGRQKGRQYFTNLAEQLPEGTVILTAGCAKYRYNKLDLGDIGGIPRVLDAGQCNDSYSLALIALKLKEVFGLDDINDLPISFDLAWYEQKAVAVLLALLHLGVKGIRLGPTLPAFLSPNVAKVLVEKFNIKATGEVKADIEAIMQGQ